MILRLFWEDEVDFFKKKVISLILYNAKNDQKMIVALCSN